ncbi:unnamed protein product [Didymodactylos carnosus]|uniref:Condensation domain-containing protein n=1 Tax=Didymodactylos carnosus TaxID=1234261 RepID=A0A815LXF8_9BILA|nr:unnamed protein product [Didymodactylos carnosus]CAF4301787.1 unnamed protein product [Didymodactylos carnosus]
MVRAPVEKYSAGKLEQHVNVIPEELINHDEYYLFAISYVSNKQELDKILQEEVNKQYFNLESGLVVRCHVIKHECETFDKDILIHGDIVLFNLHYIAFDGGSVKPFLTDLQNAYNNNIVLNTNSIQYIDYAIYERQMLDDDSSDSDINQARIYWKTILDGYNTEKHLLPYD